MDAPLLHIPTKVIFGAGAIDQIGALVKEIGAQHAMVVTDAGVAAAGHAERALRGLHEAGIAATLFDAVHENPTTDDVDACLAAAQSAGIDLLIGLGGGSSIDTARGCNFLLTNGGRMQDYWGVGKATRPMLPMIAVPTTTGTGSEMQSFALIADAETGQKMACGDRKAAARAAILDPQLAVTQPKFVIACTGLDCIAHAIETAVTTKRSPGSQMFSREAWRLARDAFAYTLNNPGDVEAQGRMMLASAYAGIAIEHSMLGAAHALSNPLTARFGVTHGQAVGMMLPHVMRFNAERAETHAEYARLARVDHAGLATASDDDAVTSLITMVEMLLSHTGFPASLRACGVDEDALDHLADEAGRQWTAQFNPRTIHRDDLRDLYQSAWEDSFIPQAGGR